MTSRPSLAIRLLGTATLFLPALTLPAATPPASAAPASPVQLAQAAQPAPRPDPLQANSLTVPVQDGSDEGRRRDDDRRAFVEAGIAALHAGLLLTPAQQGLWPPVETALRDLAATRGRVRRGGDDGFDPVARLKERGARLVARGQAMAKLGDAAAPLFAALTPEQKDRVPRLLHRIMPRGAMFGGRRRGGHGARERGMGGMGGHGMDGHGMGGGRRMDGDRG